MHTPGIRLKRHTLPDDMNTLVSLNNQLKKKVLQKKRKQEITIEPKGCQRGKFDVSGRGGSIAHFPINIATTPEKSSSLLGKFSG